MDLNDDYEDILEVLMKCRFQKRPQTQHLDKKARLIWPSKDGGVGQGRTGTDEGGRGGGRYQVWEAVGASFWIQMMIVRKFWKCLWNVDIKNVLKLNI